jgi:hypothetical protein
MSLHPTPHLHSVSSQCGVAVKNLQSLPLEWSPPQPVLPPTCLPLSVRQRGPLRTGRGAGVSPDPVPLLPCRLPPAVQRASATRALLHPAASGKVGFLTTLRLQVLPVETSLTVASCAWSAVGQTTVAIACSRQNCASTSALLVPLQL